MARHAGAVVAETLGLHPEDIRTVLAQGNPRSLGRTDAVVREALGSLSLVAALVECLRCADDVVEARAANALRKIAAIEPGSLKPYAKAILRAALACNSPQARWNLTLLLGTVGLKGRDRAAAVDLLFLGLQSGSAFQRTFAMQALADLAMEDSALRKRILPLLEELTANGTAAMRARGRKLLQALASQRKG